MDICYVDKQNLGQNEDSKKTNDDSYCMHVCGVKLLVPNWNVNLFPSSVCMYEIASVLDCSPFSHNGQYAYCTFVHNC